MGSIRPRILKVPSGHLRSALMRSCSGLDPTEDTESSTFHRPPDGLGGVAVGSIRPRILKGRPGALFRGLILSEVAVGSIRPRILKEHEGPGDRKEKHRCSGLDPTEDTESDPGSRGQPPCLPGCSGLDPTEDTESGTSCGRPGRWRPRCSGLDPTEDTESSRRGHHLAPGDQRCSGLDPTEDTESRYGGEMVFDIVALQWARSDRGY